MKKTLAVLLAATSIAGLLSATPAHAQRGLAAGVAAGGPDGDHLVATAFAVVTRRRRSHAAWSLMPRPQASAVSASAIVAVRL